MIYSWLCKNCTTDTEVDRPMANIEQGPDNGCKDCGNKDLVRVIRTSITGEKSFILKGSGWHADQYLSNKSRN